MGIDVDLLKKNVEQILKEKVEEKQKDISKYQETISSIENEEVRKLLEDIKEQEEENVAKLMMAIEQLSSSGGT